jgi:hypothetical protein
MLNIWGICSLGAGAYDQMTHWDLSCTFFTPGEEPRVERPERCCARCAYWLVFDEPRTPGDP